MPVHLPLVLGAGTASAVLFVLLQGLFLAPVPLIVAGLRLGLRGGVLASVVGAAGVALIGLDLGVLGQYIAIDVLPALVILYSALQPVKGVAVPNLKRAEHWPGAGPVLATLTLVPVAAMVAAAAFSGGSLAAAVQQVTGGELTDLLVANSAVVFGPEAGAQLADLVADPDAEQMLAGSFAVTLAMLWLIQAALAGVLGVVLAGRMGPLVRPRPVFADLRLPNWFAVLFLVTVLGAVISDLALYVLLVLAVPFMLLGFKLVHQAVRTTPVPGLLLVTFYVLFFVLFTISPAVMVFVGLVEFAADLRRDAGGRSLEDE